MASTKHAHAPAVMRRSFLCFLIVLLASCASVQEQMFESPDDWSDRMHRQQQISDWSIKARLGVQTETEGGSFDVFWQQHEDSYEIRLVAPMGQGAVQIQGDNGGVTISLADGRTEYAHDADRLFTAMTGLSLPVNGLRDWLHSTHQLERAGAALQDRAARLAGGNEPLPACCRSRPAARILS